MELTQEQGVKLARFFAKRIELDSDSDCVIWTGAQTSSGYGLCRILNTAIVAHRVAWYLYYGEWPPAWPASGLVLDHTCSNKLCVNVNHLQVVTHEENMRKPKPRRKQEIKHCKCCSHYQG